VIHPVSAARLHAVRLRYEGETMAPEKVVVRRRRKGGITDSALVNMFRQHRAARHERESFQARETELKERLMATLETTGYVDEKGNRYLDLPEEVDGFSRLKRQRTEIVTRDDQRAEELLTKRGLWKDATVVVRVVDESKLASLVFEGKLSKKDFDSLFDTNERFSFVPVK
jgi:hypothetical protein